MLDSASPPLPWSPDMCRTCPVPDILRANACDNMILDPHVDRPFPFIRRQVSVSSYCLKTKREGFDPHLGCGECHPLPPVFTEGKSITGGKPFTGERLETDDSD